jgi:hypothetical protein
MNKLTKTIAGKFEMQTIKSEDKIFVINQGFGKLLTLFQNLVLFTFLD